MNPRRRSLLSRRARTNIAGHEERETIGFRVYVIELDPTILIDDRKFREANPQYVPGWDCLYVGMTGLTRRARWRNHRIGHKAARRVKKYGVRLRRELSKGYGGMFHEAALAAERELASKLRDVGYAGWQN